MLGDKLGEEHGKVTSRRALPGDDPRYQKMEVTYESEATLLGLQGMNLGTYTVFERIPGQLYGEGQGMLMTADGGAIWNGHGVGHMTEDGGMAFAASVTFQTNSPKLQKLNSVLVLVEHQADMQGNAKSTFYEWKA